MANLTVIFTVLAPISEILHRSEALLLKDENKLPRPHLGLDLRYKPIPRGVETKVGKNTFAHPGNGVLFFDNNSINSELLSGLVWHSTMQYCIVTMDG